MALSRTATLLLKLGEKSYHSAVGMVRRLDDSQKRKVARMLIDHDFAWVVAHALEHFSPLDTAIAVRLITTRQDLGGIVAHACAQNGWSKKEISKALSANGQSWALHRLDDRVEPF